MMLLNLILMPAIILAQWTTPATGGTTYTPPTQPTQSSLPAAFPFPISTPSAYTPPVSSSGESSSASPTATQTPAPTTPSKSEPTQEVSSPSDDNGFDFFGFSDFFGGDESFFDYDNYFAQEDSDLELLTRKRKKFFYPAIVENLPIGQVTFKGSVADPRWRITNEGKLRGNTAQVGILADLVNGNVQINFSGGRNKIGGQITFYEVGNSRNSQFVDLTNNRIYSEEIVFGSPSIFLGLLFNGPVIDPTIFGRIVTESGGFDEYGPILEEDVFAEESISDLVYAEELFFITSSGSNAQPIKNGPSVSVPKITIPQDLLDKISETLYESAEELSSLIFNKASAAVASLSNILRLINEYNVAINDSFVIDEIFSDIDYGGGIDYFSDEQMGELIGLGGFYNNRIENVIKPQLGNYVTLTRPADWYFSIDSSVFELVESLGISETFASFLLQVPTPFSVTFLKDEKIVFADCNNFNGFKCVIVNNKNSKERTRLFKERLDDYDRISSDYRQGITDVENSLFGG